PGLTAEIPGRPAQRREEGLADFKLLAQPDPQGAPVESFMTMESIGPARTEITLVHRTLNRSPGAGENHLPQLREGKSLAVLVVPQAAPASQRADHLLAQEAGAGL